MNILNPLNDFGTNEISGDCSTRHISNNGGRKTAIIYDDIKDIMDKNIMDDMFDVHANIWLAIKPFIIHSNKSNKIFLINNKK